MRFTLLSAATILAVTVSACSDPLLPGTVVPDRDEQESSRGAPWRQMTDAELAAKITDAGGRVFIGFKDPDSAAGVDEAGRVLASPSSVAAGKAELRAVGIEILFEFSDMPMVVAQMSAALLPAIRRHPLVDYVEPILPGLRTQ